MQIIASLQSFHALKEEPEEAAVAKAESVLRSTKDRGKAWNARLSADHVHVYKTEEYIKCAFIKGRNAVVTVVLLPV